MQVDNLGVGVNAASTSKIVQSIDKTTDKQVEPVVEVDTKSADSVTLSSEAIALSKEEQGTTQRTGGDGNGESPGKPPKS
jgi:hypothetical protein